MANVFQQLDEQKAPPANPFSRVDAPGDSPLRITVTPARPDSPASTTAPPPPDVGRGTAALEGYLSGASANFRDEIFGASEASGLPREWGGFRAPVGAAKMIWEYLSSNPGEATAIYEKARNEKRELQKQAQQQYPGTYLASEIGGALLMPTGKMNAATLPGRALQGAGLGAAYGGLSGFGSGEDWTDRAIKGGTGTVFGGALGGAVTPIVEGGLTLANLATQPIRRAFAGAVNPEAEATRRIAVARQRDVEADPNATARLTPQEFADAQNRGQPVMVGDLGGDLTRRLMDSAAITSPEGGTALNRALNERFEEQGPRLASYLNQTLHFPNADAQQQAIEQTARAVNRPAYRRAFTEHDGPMWDEALGGLAQDPVVQSAIRRAGVAVRTERTLDGYRPFRNPFTFEENSGRLTLRADENGRTIYPDLQFWDLVKRELDKQGTREAQSFARSLRDHLDELTRDASGVSSYQTARQGAAHFFGAENALEAGQNFVGAGARYGLPEARRALANMTDQQRQLFQDGYGSRLIEKINALPDRRSALNIIGRSPADREELYIALGRDRAHELEAWLRVEGIKDLPRQVVQGNSWTAKRLYDLGLAGGSATTVYGAYNQDPQQMTIGTIVAALGAGGRHVDQRVARRVAELLISDDPAVFQRGVQMLARNQTWLNGLRAFDRRVSAALGEQAGDR